MDSSPSEDARTIAARRIVESSFDGETAPDPGQRQQLLTDHPELGSEIEQELRKIDRVRLAIRKAGSPSDEIPDGDELAGAQLGRYRLTRKIGTGGFGDVWVADQREPVSRSVAVKVIKLGMDTRDVIARFEAERQALALMDHSGIAKVLDAGATETGRPYFVMELVRGTAITSYCDARRLGTAARLTLFMSVCHAVQHAHQKGIIHRDLKPSNILVADEEGQAMPKVIDFGIAKAIDRQLGSHTWFTRDGQFIGTPTHMSPEQASGSFDIDTRSDVYALGVILYELLAGVPPFDPVRLGLMGSDEVQRVIREEEPVRPSTRVGRFGSRIDGADEDDSLCFDTGSSIDDIAQHRHTDPSNLERSLRGDLDWIVMKALAKERERRYGSAAGLADDIHRSLVHEPVVAGPPSAVYRLKKFARRNRMLLSTGSTIAAALIMALMVSVYAYGEAADERTEAVAARRESDKVTDFTISMFERANPITGRNVGDLQVRDVLQQAVAAIERDRMLADSPRMRAGVHHAVGRLYQAIDEFDLSERHLREALAVRVEFLGPEHEVTLSVRNDLAELYDRSDEHGRAEQTYREVLEVEERIFGREHPLTVDALCGLGSTLCGLRRYDEAEPLLLEAHSLAKRLPEIGARFRLQCANNLGGLRYRQGMAAMDGDRAQAAQSFGEAETYWDETMQERLVLLGARHKETLVAQMNVARVRCRLGACDDAIRLGTDAYERSIDTNGPFASDTAKFASLVAWMQWQCDDAAQADIWYQRALDLHRELGLPPMTGQMLAGYAAFLESVGRAEAALGAAREAIALLGEMHPRSAAMAELISRIEGSESPPDP